MTSIDALLALFYKVFYFILLRESAQTQLIIIVLVLLLSWFGSKKLLQILDRFLPHVLADEPGEATVIEQEYSDEISKKETEAADLEQGEPPRLSIGQQFVEFVRTMVPELMLPVLAIGLFAIVQGLLTAQGYLTGLLVQFNWFLILFLGYRVVVGLLQYLLPAEYAFRYHYQLLLPVLVLYVIFQSIGWFIDPQLLGQIVVFELFETPVTWGNIFVATVGFYLWLQLARLLQDVLYFLITRYTEAQHGTVNASLTLVRYGFVVIGVILVFNALQFNSATVAAIAAGVSAGIAFASREILNNFIGGIILLFEQSIRPGDTIEIGVDMGVVTAVNIRSTLVQAFDGREIIVPNSQVLTSSVITHTKSSRYARIRIDIGVSYEADPRRVLEILREIPPSHENIIDDPAPNAFLVGFGESSVDFTLFAWVADISDKFLTTHELYFMIWDAFAKEGIEIPFPQRDLHMRSDAPWE